MNIVELENVTKAFGTTIAVKALSLNVPSGSIYGFIGPNGSGKTTTLRMIMGIHPADEGVVRVFGAPIHGACSDRIGYLPEERGMYRRMRVREILNFYGGLKAGHGVAREVDRWLDKFDMTSWANRKIEALSKGMSQKVQFLMAVVAKPQLLILDEPFSGLDPLNADTLREAILELRGQGTTVILSTHDMHLAETLCDFIFMIFQGAKVLDGTLMDIQNQYGADTVHVQTAGGFEIVRNLPGVDAVNDLGQLQELRLGQDGDAQEVLRILLERTQVLRFEITRPSLHDIFVRIARPQAQEVAA